MNSLLFPAKFGPKFIVLPQKPNHIGSKTYMQVIRNAKYGKSRYPPPLLLLNDHTVKLSLDGNDSFIPAEGEFGTSDIPVGNGNVANLFIQYAVKLSLDGNN
jgi:hypothetical protein